MSGFTAIDLSRLPAPQIIEALDAEAVIAAIKVDVLAYAPELAEVLALESEPVVKLIEAFAYREILVRARINDAAEAVMLAKASGTDLDHLAALFGVERLMVTAPDTTVAPAIAEILEADAALRFRTQLALEGFSVAGPRGAYMFHALSADASIKDVAVTSPTPGEVLVTLLTHTDTGLANSAVIAAVGARLNADDIRPLTDSVSVQSASILTYQVEASLEVREGPDAGVVLAQAQAALAAYVAESHMIGSAVRLSAIYAALHQPGVERVVLAQPVGDIIPSATQAASCTGMSVVLA